MVNAVAAVPVFIVDKMFGSKPPKPGEPLKPQSAKSQVMTASAVSFTMVYEAMENGAKLVFLGARTSASGVVGHKYGPDAGRLAEDTMASGGHAFNAYTSYRNIAVKAIARKTAKTTAKRAVYGYMHKNTGVDVKKMAKQNAAAQIKSQASSLKAGLTPKAGSGGSGSQHHIMLESHNSRRAESMDAAAAAAHSSAASQGAKSLQ